MAEQIIQEIYSQIQSKKKILATPPQEDAPSVDIANIRMPSLPSYKVGDKVQSGACFSGPVVLRFPKAVAQMRLLEGWEREESNSFRTRSDSSGVVPVTSLSRTDSSGVDLQRLRQGKGVVHLASLASY